MIFSSLAYITMKRLSFCISAGERGEGREREFSLKKKSVRNNFSQVNNKERFKKKKIKRSVITISMRNNVRNCSLTIDAVGSFRHFFASKW